MPGTVLLTEKMIRNSQEIEGSRNLGISLETTELAVAENSLRAASGAQPSRENQDQQSDAC